MCKIDIKFSPERCQSSVGSIQQGFCVHIVRRPKPFAFEYAPQCFRNVQMRGVWGQEEKEQPSLFPNGPKLVYEFAPVYFSVVQLCVVINVLKSVKSAGAAFVME